MAGDQGRRRGEEEEEEEEETKGLTWRSGWWRCAGAQCGQMLAQQPRQKMFFSFFFRFSCAAQPTKKLSSTSPPTHPGLIPISLVSPPIPAAGPLPRRAFLPATGLSGNPRTEQYVCTPAGPTDGQAPPRVVLDWRDYLAS